MKTCRHCKTEKPFSDFYKQSASCDGYNYWCKKCSHENNARYMRQRRQTKNTLGVRTHGERLQLSATDALTRFELRLNFVGIERLL